jgi:uncharacterized membrane protein
LKNAAAAAAGLERTLESLLRHGTRLASAIIAAGLVLVFASETVGLSVATAGIALFILLPVARVAAMLIFFVRAGDYRLATIAALVISIVVLGYLLGNR